MVKYCIFIISAILTLVFGLKFMKDSLTSITTSKIKKIIINNVNNDFKALVIGIIITALCQSSNAVTILTLAFISTNYISFDKGLLIIMGANIGTTITPFLFSFKLNWLIPLILLIGFILLFIEKTKLYGCAIVALGMVLFSLEIISEYFTLIINEKYIKRLFTLLNASYLFSFFTGIVISALIQSSSASIGITQKLSSSNFLSFNTSVAFMLGANIGTTLIGLITSLFCDKKTIKVALINVIFNVLTAILFLSAINNFTYYIDILGNIFNLNVMSKIALSHFIYNLISVIMFFTIYKIKKVD